MGFQKAYPYLHRFVEIGGTVRIGEDYNTEGLIHCYDEGGTVYESPANLTDIDEALANANKGIKKWMKEVMPEELDDD